MLNDKWIEPSYDLEKWVNLVYVAGPYRAETHYIVKQNIRKAEDIGVLLWAYGWVPIVPHLNTEFMNGAYGLPDWVWLKGDLAIVKACKFIVVEGMWRYSDGTIGEIECAKENNIPVLYWENERHRYFLRTAFEDWRR
jgi:hypothetical protein